MKAVLEKNDAEIYSSDFSEKVFRVDLTYNDVKELSDKLIQKNLQAYLTLANA